RQESIIFNNNNNNNNNNNRIRVQRHSSRLKARSRTNATPPAESGAPASASRQSTKRRVRACPAGRVPAALAAAPPAPPAPSRRVRLGADDVACQLESPTAQQVAWTDQAGAVIQSRVGHSLVADLGGSAQQASVRRVNLLLERLRQRPCIGVVQQDGLDHRLEQRRPLAVQVWPRIAGLPSQNERQSRQARGAGTPGTRPPRLDELLTTRKLCLDEPFGLWRYPIKQSGSKEAPITMHLKLPAALTEEVARPSSAPPPHHQQHQVQEPPSSPIVVVQPRDPVGYVRMETRRKACLPSAATDEDNNAAENSDSASAAPEFDDEAYRRLGKRTDCDVKRLVCCLCSLQLPSLLHLETHLEWLHSSQRSTKAARHCPACRLVFPTSTDCLVHLRMRHGVTPETARIPNDLWKLAEQRERERVHHRVRLSDPTSAGSNVNHHNNNNNNNNNKISDSSCSQAKKRCKMPPRRHARSAFFGGSKRSRSGRRLTHSVGKRDSAASTSVAGNGSSHGDRAQPQHLAATHSSLLLATGPTPAGHKCPVCAANFITMGGASLHAQDEHPDVAIYLPCLYCPVRCWARSALKLQDHLSDRHPAEWSAPDGGDRLLQVAWRSAIWRRRGEPTEDLPVASGAANPTVTASGALRLTFSNLSTSSGASAAAGGASDTSAEQLGLGN
uniref:C2H2-type domain-containing protein n=1 Tax=Macrostomum lignano TaxID=282301 RepID=A0A1I8IQS1_9PLAT